MKRAPAHRDARSTAVNVASRRTIRTLVSTYGSCDATFVGWMPFSGGPALGCLRFDVCGRWLIFGRGIVDTYLAALTHPTTHFRIKEKRRCWRVGWARANQRGKAVNG